MNARCAPSGVLGHHSEDQISHLLRDSLPPEYSARSGDGAPIERESGAAPTNYCFRADNNESLLPT